MKVLCLSAFLLYSFASFATENTDYSGIYKIKADSHEVFTIKVDRFLKAMLLNDRRSKYENYRVKTYLERFDSQTGQKDLGSALKLIIYYANDGSGEQTRFTIYKNLRTSRPYIVTSTQISNDGEAQFYSIKSKLIDYKKREN